MGIDYKKAGVDEEKAENLISYIKEKTKTIFQKNVIGEIGFFSGFFSFPSTKYKNPVLVSSTDGVGTKILLAQQFEEYRGIGIDLVAMNVNDVAVSGAEILFLLDYIAVGEIKGKREKEIMDGIIEGCKIAGCSLIGGEVAQMKDVYGKDGFDLAGFCVGIVERSKIPDFKRIKAGDVLVGINSNGIHSNGFSLVRKIFKKKKLEKYYEEIGMPIWKELLKPTFIYSPLLHELFSSSLIKAASHITGGGIPGNLIRILPENLKARIEKKSLKILPVFAIIKKEGKIEEKEMFNVFNMGIGTVLVVKSQNLNKVMEMVRKFNFIPYVIGEIIEGRKSVEIV